MNNLHSLAATGSDRSVLRLGYLQFEVRKPERWTEFCLGMLGLPMPVANTDGSLGFRMDGAAQRLIVQEGAADDLAAIGFEAVDEESLDRVLARITSFGVRVEQGGAPLRSARRVKRLHRVVDPAGNRVELFFGPEAAAQPFESGVFPACFRTGDAGMGHVAIVADDLAAMEQFYTGVLGFGVSERLSMKAGPIDVNGTFLHCNLRHHSLALFKLPLRKRIHHFMLQANAWSDVGVAYERALRNKLPMSLSLGQHPGPDGTFSFYAATPSGFDFEIGAGSGEIDPAQWQVLHTAGASTWGHKPQLRLRLKMLGELIASKLARPAAPALAGKVSNA
jgi:biphenyl-2,3-diol 1,2-dioxygenase